MVHYLIQMIDIEVQTLVQNYVAECLKSFANIFEQKIENNSSDVT